MDQSVSTGREQPILIENGLCSRYRCSQSSCVECMQVCPVPDAIHLSGEGAEISEACIACGACVSACPNGALGQDINNLDLGSRTRNREHPSEPFRIACDRANGKADLVLSCLCRLTEGVVLEPLRWGAQSVELRSPDCSGCGLHKTAGQWKKVIKLARGLLESVNLDAGRIVHLTTPLGTPRQTLPAQKTGVSRRDFFRAFADKWEEADASPGIDAEDPLDVAITPFRDLVRNHAENPKRSHLLNVLQALPGARPLKAGYAAQGLPVASIEIGPKCTGCNVCETLCPVGAIHHSDSERHYELSYTPSLCTGCRVCEEACFHRAVRVSDNVDLSLLFLGTQQKLVTGEKNTCEFCRQPFLGSTDESFCPLCITTEKRREKMARRFARRGTENV